MPGFRSYMVEDQFDDALISLSKSAKILNKQTNTTESVTPLTLNQNPIKYPLSISKQVTA